MGRLYGLDALRGFAALAVLLYHLSPDAFGRATDGWLAVDFFFMLSGYVMSRALTERPQRSMAFLRARYRRFWPTMAIGTALGAVAALATDAPVSPMLVIAGLLLIPSPVGIPFPLNTPAWSIFYELAANAMHPTLSRFGFRVILIASGVLMLVAVHQLQTFSFGPTYFWLGLARTLMAYCLGALLFDAWRDKPPVVVPLPVGIAALCFPAFITTGPFFGFVYVLVLCPIILAAGLSASPRWGGPLGAMSFPLYATHVPVVVLAERAGLSWMLAAAAAVSIAGAVALVTGRWWLRPRTKPA